MAGEIKVEGNTVVFQLHGIDKILAIKSQLRIPIGHIVEVSTERADWDMYNQLRIGGTAIPGVVKDGRYVSKEGWFFFEMHNPDRCVTVTLKDERYKKIIFEVKDKEESASQLRNLIQN